jgi:hypothetical protein
MNLSTALTLDTQLARVEYVMQDGAWRTLAEVVAATRERFDRIDTEAAASARLRDLRRLGWTVERRGRDGSRRWIEYRATAPVRAGEQVEMFR